MSEDESLSRALGKAMGFIDSLEEASMVDESNRIANGGEEIPEHKHNIGDIITCYTGGDKCDITMRQVAAIYFHRRAGRIRYEFTNGEWIYETGIIPVKL